MASSGGWRPVNDTEDDGPQPVDHGHGHGHGLQSLLQLRNASGPLARLGGLALREGLLLLVGSVALIIATAINVFMPYSLGTILKDGLNEGSFAAVVRITLFFLVLYVVGSFMTSVRVYCFTVAGERVVRSLRLRLYSSLLNQPMAFFDSTRSGELVNRLSADCELIRITLTNTAVVMARFGLQIIGGAAFLFYLSWSLTLVMLGVVPILAVAGWLYSKRARSFGRSLQNALATNTATAGEVLSGVRHVRLFDQEEHESLRYKALLDSAYTIATKLGIANALFMGAAEFGSYAAVMAVILYGTFLVINGGLSIDFITSYVLYAVYVAHALGAISHQGAELSRAAGASERVFELLDRVEVKGGLRTRPATQSERKLRGDIEFSSVSFEYPKGFNDTKSAGLVLQDLSFKIRAGQSVGIVGPSGAGKSSILQLVPRLYDVTEGSINIDGDNIASYDPHWLRRQIGFVSQEPVLFHGTIRENILYGRPDATDEEVVEAAKAALIHDTIMSQPLGYNSLIGDRGVGLSGGQRQRIAIARVFLKDAPIILMDEPTSALDSENEAFVVQAIQRLFSNRTCLIITHRSDLLRIVEQVLVINHGTLEAFGDSRAVASASTTYKRLFSQT